MAVLSLAGANSASRRWLGKMRPEIRARSQRRTLPGGDSANGSRCGTRPIEQSSLRDYKAKRTRTHRRRPLQTSTVDIKAHVVVRRSFTKGRLKCTKTEASLRAVPLQAIALD